MPINFSQFQENISKPADGQFVVGYFNTAAGGERRTSIQTLRSSIIGDLSGSWVTNFALTTGTNSLVLSDTSAGNNVTFQTATTARAGLMSAAQALTLVRVTSTYDVFGGLNTADYILVAGGGAGGNGSPSYGGGGGGAGGALSGTFAFQNNDSFTIIVGAGSPVGISTGSNTSINPLNISVLGGGSGTFYIGNAGGSGAGGGGGSYVGGSGTLGQGNNGGSGTTATAGGAGGGGGKGAVGGTGSSAGPGSGGSGVGWNGYNLAGGGSGGGNNSPNVIAKGGFGGGGDGANNTYGVYASRGQINTGGGGGGGSLNGYLSAAGQGGSGVVIFKYPINYSVTTTPSDASSLNQFGGFKYTVVKESCVATFTAL